jgi:hypothetical protein
VPRKIRAPERDGAVARLITEWIDARLTEDHELCHLEHRDHSAAFWGLVRRVLPGYMEWKDWLEGREVRVG